MVANELVEPTVAAKLLPIAANQLPLIAANQHLLIAAILAATPDAVVVAVVAVCSQECVACLLAADVNQPVVVVELLLRIAVATN